MNLLRTPRGKLLAASGLLVLLLLAPGSAGAADLARWLMAGVALVGLGLWLRRGSGRPAPWDPPLSLQITARAGLSPRCAVALVRAGGRSFLIAHGDGFARIHPLPRECGRGADPAVLQ